jgi:hypothetical protein
VTRFCVIADVSSDNLVQVRPVLLRMIDGAVVTDTADGLHVRGIMDGADARDVNRRLLSALRQAGKEDPPAGGMDRRRLHPPIF